METMAIGVRVWVENLQNAIVADASVQVAVSVVPLEVVLVGVVEDVVTVMEEEEGLYAVVAVVVEVVAGVDVVGIRAAVKAIIYFPDEWFNHRNKGVAVLYNCWRITDMLIMSGIYMTYIRSPRETHF